MMRGVEEENQARPATMTSRAFRREQQMRVIEGGEVVSSGDGGGGTCHNDKPGQSKDKVLKVESRRVEVRGELEGGSGGTCHNDKPGRMMGMTMGGEGGSR